MKNSSPSICNRIMNTGWSSHLKLMGNGMAEKESMVSGSRHGRQYVWYFNSLYNVIESRKQQE